MEDLVIDREEEERIETIGKDILWLFNHRYTESELEEISQKMKEDRFDFVRGDYRFMEKDHYYSMVSEERCVNHTYTLENKHIEYVLDAVVFCNKEPDPRSYLPPRDYDYDY